MVSAHPGGRRVRWAGLMVFPLLLAAACGGGGGSGGAGGTGGTGGGGSPEPAACQASSGTVELEYWSWVPGMEDVAAMWNEENPNIKVTVKSTPAGNAGTYQSMFNALKANTAPDLGQVEYDTLASFRLQEGLADISGCPGVAEAQAGFVDWSWSQSQIGGPGVYAIPQDTGPMAMYYRKDIF